MKLLLSILVYITLANPPCLAQALPAGKNEVVFARYFREYGWRFYGSDGKKLDRPMQSILDVYGVDYRLTPDSLLVGKRPYLSKERQTLLYSQALSKADSQLVAQMLAATALETLGNTTIEDGLVATVTLGGHSTSFAVGGEPTIMSLLYMIDRLAPLKYKLYEPGERVDKQ